jgi:hypothetical protein
VVVINERFARSTFGERNPIGQILTIRDEFRSGDDLEIVGVVGDVVQARVEDGMLPAVYVPHTQMASMLNVVVRSARGAESLASEIRRALAGGSLANAPVVGLSPISST